MTFEVRPIARVIEESLIIFGCVANWGPIEIQLYAWWPIAPGRTLYRRLARAAVELRPFEIASQEQHVRS